MRRIHGTNIYNGFVPTFPEDRQGWNSEHTSFEEIIRGLRPLVVIDVGAWKGASTIYLADLMKRNGVAGTVIAVDTFLGSVEHWDRSSGFAGLIPHRFGMPLLYEQFLQLTNIETQFPPIFAQFFGDPALRTCRRCHAVMQPPLPAPATSPAHGAQ